MSRERVTVAPTAPSREERASIVDRARRRGFTRFALDAADEIAPLPGDEILLHERGRLTLPGPPPVLVPIVNVGDPAALESALRATPPGGVLAVDWTGDRIIPLENAIAGARGRFGLWVYARSPREVPGALGALEHGAHRVIVEVHSPEEVDELESIMEGPTSRTLDWVLVPVESVRAVGLGDRVLVDTTSLLEPSEGMLVGSAAGFLFHVASEAVGSRFSRARPFRVNAGAAHSYVLMADGSTRYLSELDPGDAVLVSRPAGEVRPVRVGRVKIERRPLVVVTVNVEGARRTIFLQEAETVRLSAEASRIPTTELAAGAKIHGVRMPAGRHLGQAVQETILER
jgi:3-dehydroquinate synthase II